jgi:hypothetical protein
MHEQVIVDLHELHVLQFAKRLPVVMDISMLQVRPVTMEIVIIPIHVQILVRYHIVEII